MDECAENGVKVGFEVLKSGFLVTFARRPEEKSIPSSIPSAGGGTRKGTRKRAEKAPVEGKAGRARRALLALMRQESGATAQELAAKIGLSPKAVEWHIRQLKAENKLKRVGGRRTGRWEVVG